MTFENIKIESKIEGVKVGAFIQNLSLRQHGISPIWIYDTTKSSLFEKNAEAIISHESVHLVIYKLTRRIKACKGLDYFEYDLGNINISFPSVFVVDK